MSIELRVLCEGNTEQGFVTQVLAPHFRAFDVFPRSEPLARGRSGTVSFKVLFDAIKRDVGRTRNHQYVTTMIDLHGLTQYPGAEKQPGESVLDRVARIETNMATALPNERFIPYIQVHEFEALVFVDLDALPPQFPDGEAGEAPARLKQQVGLTAPEEINDGTLTAPSKRLIREIPVYEHMKPIVGPAIAASIGMARLRAACPISTAGSHTWRDWPTTAEVDGDSTRPDLHTVQLFLDHANISTSSRYLKPSKLPFTR